MRVAAMGDRAFVLRDLPLPAYEAARALEAAGLAGVIEAVASYDTVGVYVEAGFDPGVLSDVFSADGIVGRQPITPTPIKEEESREARTHLIPVCYELGEDLRELGLTPAEVAGLHCSIEYTCYAVGFCPGFAYLGYLPAGLAGVKRRPEPRARVEPGSVGITGRQTGVYPLPRPGGWALIGRTPLTLVDVADGYFPIQAGDRVRFSPIDAAEFERLRSERL